MAVIKISDYPVFVRLGCFESERVAGQEVLVSLVLDLGPRGQGLARTDDISSTLDYAAALVAVDCLIANKAINLIESAVAIIGFGLLREFPSIFELDVTITKRRIPSGLAKGAIIAVSEHFLRSELPV